MRSTNKSFHKRKEKNQHLTNYIVLSNMLSEVFLKRKAIMRIFRSVMVEGFDYFHKDYIEIINFLEKNSLENYKRRIQRSKNSLLDDQK